MELDGAVACAERINPKGWDCFRLRQVYRQPWYRAESDSTAHEPRAGRGQQRRALKELTLDPGLAGREI